MGDRLALETSASKSASGSAVVVWDDVSMIGGKGGWRFQELILLSVSAFRGLLAWRLLVGVVK